MSEENESTHGCTHGCEENPLLFLCICMTIVGIVCILYNSVKGKKYTRDTILLLLNVMNGVTLSYALWKKDTNLIELCHNIFVGLVIISIIIGKSIQLLTFSTGLTALTIFTRGYYENCLFAKARGGVRPLLPEISNIIVIDAYYIVLYAIGLIKIGIILQQTP